MPLRRMRATGGMMMKAIILCGLAASLAACSTPAARREDPARITVETTKTTNDFAACMLDFYQGKQLRPSFTPRPNGGSIEFNISGFATSYTTALIDITDLGDRRRVQFFAQSNDKDVASQIDSCA
jgi:hypothetical protein